ncbi:MAG: hypothetical protein ACLR0U_19495 [Enterocloster clostridioformis]
MRRSLRTKRFAAGCSRDVIREGAEGLGWTLGGAYGQDYPGPCDPAEAAVR